MYQIEYDYLESLLRDLQIKLDAISVFSDNNNNIYFISDLCWTWLRKRDIMKQ